LQLTAPAREAYRFGAFEFQPRTGELRKQGRKVRLREQAVQILTLLLARPGDLVTREEIQKALWPDDTFVDFDVGLNSAIRRLRDALDDSAEQPRFVETLPRRGYRFIAPIETEATASTATAPEQAAELPPAQPPLPEVSAVDPRRWRPLAIAAVAALGAAALVLALRARPETIAAPPPAVAITSIAVLPFENLGADVEQDYFVDGMTDALITSLAQLRALRVISRTSVTQYTKTDKLLPRIAADLNVDAIVEGTVVRSGNRVRVTAQLIHAATDRHLWAHSYERELSDILTLQSELAGAIARAVKVELRPDEQRRLARTAVVNPVAYDAYLKGRFHLFAPAGRAKAAEYFQQSIAADPAYAPAYSGLSDTYRLSAGRTARPSESMPKAEAAARKALALDDTLAEAHASLAGVLYRYQWDWEGAERHFQRSLDLDPNYAEGHRAYAVYLLTLRRHEEAVSAARRATALSPLAPTMAGELGVALARAGRYDEAFEQARRILELDPNSGRAQRVMALAHEGRGDRARALAALEESAALFAAGSRGPWLGYYYGVSGRRKEALEVLASLEERARAGYVSPQHFAVVHLGLGDEDQAFAYLEKAYEERAFEVLGFSGPLFDHLKGDPRFQDLLRRMRLPTT
jgi:TolB-like protein/DNA-binding winged helix-turn-helix (wHTH) protein/Flp pilus assembly protein TadD